MLLNCVICNKEFKRFGKQALVAKTCSFKCLGIYNRAKPNTTCTQCSKKFHMKKSQKDNYKRTNGYFCSRKCFANFKKDNFKGKNNHQYGLKGNLNSSFKGEIIPNKNNNLTDLLLYKPNHPKANESGRVLLHRYIVEENYNLYDLKYFEKIDGKYYLKDNIDVHHIDLNHNNNSINNLTPLTKSEHISLHNKLKTIKRDNKGRIIGVIKSGEFMENPEVDNHEPS